MSAANGTKRVAILNTRYPALSHTFIEREIRAIRNHGMDVLTVSIRKPEAKDRLSENHRAAERETVYVLDGVSGLIAAMFMCLITRPIGTLRGLVVSQTLSPPGIRMHLLHLAYWVEAAKLVRVLRARHIQHVHVHMANNGASVAMLACKIDSALTYSLTIHGSTEFLNMEVHRLPAKARGAVFVRCISNFCRAQVMLAMRSFDLDRLHVVHCGVDPSRFAPRPALGPGPLRLLTVGRFDPIKGYSVLLRAIRKLVSEGVDVQLTMVGDGPVLGEIRALAKQLGLENIVNFPGAIGQDDILEHYAAADALVMSSFMEGIPVVLMEAMAMELAVVTTNVAGIPELVEHGVSGLLVEPSSPEKLAAALRELADDRSLIERMGKAGRKRVVDEFNIATVGTEVAAILERVVQGKPLPKPKAVKESLALAR